MNESICTHQSQNIKASLRRLCTYLVATYIATLDNTHTIVCIRSNMTFLVLWVEMSCSLSISHSKHHLKCRLMSKIGVFKIIKIAQNLIFFSNLNFCITIGITRRQYNISLTSIKRAEMSWRSTLSPMHINLKI